MAFLNTDVIGKNGELLKIQSPVNAPVSSLKAHFSPKQEGEGEPSPDNVRPIRGWERVTVNRCGKNLYTIDKVRAHGHDDWDTIMSGEKGKSSISNFNRWTFVDVAVPNERYTYIPNCYEVGFLDENTNVIKYYMGWYKYVITAPENARYIYLTWYKNGVNTAEAALAWHNRMFLTFSDSTVGEENYEPYHGKILSIDWATEAGTIYSGYVDLIKGVVVEEWHSISINKDTPMRNFAPDKRNQGQGCEASYWLSTFNAPNAKGYIPYSHDGYCDKLEYYENAYNYDSAAAASNSTVDIRLAGVRPLEEYLSWLEENGPIQVVYKLATPIEHPITPAVLSILRGINYIWTDGNSVDISYRCAETRDMILGRRQTILAQPQISNWVTGDPIASYEGDMLSAMKNCRAYFTPTQDMNGYDKPWPGGGGKNLFNAENPIELNAWMNGSVIRGSSTDRIIYIPCKPNTIYTVSKSIGDVLAAGYTSETPETGIAYSGHIRDSSARTVTVTTDDAAAFLAVWCYDSTKTTDKDLQPEDIYAVLQIEVGAVATDWTPYANTCVIHGWDEIVVHSTGRNIFPNENGKSAPLNLKAGTVITASTSAMSGGYFRGQNKDGEHVTPIVWLNKTDETGRKVMAPYTLPEDISTGFIFLAAGVSEAQITLDGSTAYEEYAGQMTTIKFPDTFYGGYVDLARGVLVQEWNKLIADGVNLKCTPNYTYTSGDMFGGAIVYLTPDGVSDRTNIGENYVYCDKLPKNQPASEKPYIGTITAGAQYCVFYVFNKKDYGGTVPDKATIVEMTNEWLREHPITIVYRLRTPIVHHLPALRLKTLRNHNYVWTDGNGEIRLRYWLRGKIDTSPQIAYAGHRLYVSLQKPTVDSTKSVTAIYEFDYTQNRPIFVMYGCVPSLQIFKNGIYSDYYNRDTSTMEDTQSVNKGANGVRFTILNSMLDVCYAYIQQTGEILFAGKESPYFGKRNIND